MATNWDIDRRIAASWHLVDFVSEGDDAAIRYSPVPPRGLEVIKLGTETATPVCSATFAEDHALLAPADMPCATLLCGDIPKN